MKPFDVAHLATKRDCEMAADMCNEIKETIHKYDDVVPLVLVLGVLDIVKKEIIDEH